MELPSRFLVAGAVDFVDPFSRQAQLRGRRIRRPPLFGDGQLDFSRQSNDLHQGHGFACSRKLKLRGRLPSSSWAAFCVGWDAAT